MRERREATCASQNGMMPTDVPKSQIVTNEAFPRQLACTSGQAAGRLMKVVLIDDSSSSLFVEEALTRQLAGVETTAFTDSELALEYLITNDVDVVIVDYSMPRITGMEVAKRLRASARHRQTPIMMVTGSTEMAVRRRAEEVGVTELLIKPFKATEFTALLSQLLRADVG